MKLVRFGSAGQEQPGVIDSDGAVRGLSGVVEDLTPDTLGIEQLLGSGPECNGCRPWTRPGIL